MTCSVSNTLTDLVQLADGGDLNGCSPHEGNMVPDPGPVARVKHVVVVHLQAQKAIKPEARRALAPYRTRKRGALHGANKGTDLNGTERQAQWRY
jgi:hypothetical protein